MFGQGSQTIAAKKGGGIMGFQYKALIVLLFSSFCTAQVFAGDDRFDPDLKGRYRFTATATCTESVGGFTPRPGLQQLGGATTDQDTFTGTMTFDGRGGALETIKGMTMFYGPNFPGNSAVGTFDGLCSFKHEMTGEVSFSLAGTCSGTLPDGPSAGQTFTTTGIRLDGQVSRDKEVILITGATPAEQKIALSGGYVANRFCTSSATLVRR
jgi:hypothetical protein